MNEPLPLPWTCPSCGASNQSNVSQTTGCRECAWQPKAHAMDATKAFLLLLCGLAPSVVILLGFDIKNGFLQMSGTAILINLVCSLISGIGFSLRLKDFIGRIFVGTALPVLLFAFNVVVAVVVGCSGMGRIAP